MGGTSPALSLRATQLPPHPRGPHHWAGTGQRSWLWSQRMSPRQGSCPGVGSERNSLRPPPQGSPMGPARRGGGGPQRTGGGPQSWVLLRSSGELRVGLSGRQEEAPAVGEDAHLSSRPAVQQPEKPGCLLWTGQRQHGLRLSGGGRPAVLTRWDFRLPHSCNTYPLHIHYVPGTRSGHRGSNRWRATTGEGPGQRVTSCAWCGLPQF